MDDTDRLYTRIDAFLKDLLEETDAILGGAEDLHQRITAARAIAKRLSAARQGVLERLAACVALARAPR